MYQIVMLVNSERETFSIDIRSWESVSKQLFGVLRLTTNSTVRSVLVQFEPNIVNLQTEEMG